MGKLSNAVLDYFDDNVRFANLFNGSLFGGRNVVNPQELMEGSEVYPDEDPAVEDQNLVDYTMPWRNMNYDALEYKKQIKMIKRYNRSQNLLKTSAERMCGLRSEDCLAPTYERIVCTNGSER